MGNFSKPEGVQGKLMANVSKSKIAQKKTSLKKVVGESRSVTAVKTGHLCRPPRMKGKVHKASMKNK